MDFLLPVAPGGIDGRACGPRYWRDIPRGAPIEIAQADVPVVEPLSLDDAKRHLQQDLDVDDEWILSAITAARRQVETDLNFTLAQTLLEMVFDQFPIERWIPLPRPPLVSVTSVKSYDTLTGAESTFASTNYLVDTYSKPGRICLVTGSTWPSGVRSYLGAKVRWTAGYADGTVPDRYVHAIKLLLGHWYQNREAVTDGRAAGQPMEVPLGYEALIGDRLVSVG